MRLRKIFSLGKIIDKDLYKRLIKLDSIVFSGANNEFLKNREWWVIVDKKKIIAFCGCLYSIDGICIFVRAWVYEEYRGQGIQKQMIIERLKAAKKKSCKTAITYTTYSNFISANNLFKCGFLLYNPEYKYSGGMLYFKYNL